MAVFVSTFLVTYTSQLTTHPQKGWSFNKGDQVMVANGEGAVEWDQVGTVVARGIITETGDFVPEHTTGGQPVYRVQGAVDKTEVFEIPFERVLGLSWLFGLLGGQVNVAKTIGKVLRVRWDKGTGFEVDIRISGNALREIEVEEGKEEGEEDQMSTDEE